ncbi:MAG: nucleoside hydrolase [Erysipelotrichaceae bacterium]|nr:nucleoside hydrolase [Erysipelotrichaceae bacterium]
MKNIIIDCDPGHDDIIASMVAMAHPEQFNILGFTTVAGNQTLEKVTNNLLKVQTLLGTDYPVSMGYDAPIIKPLEVQPLAHGESGLDGPILPEAKRSVTGLHAIEFMKETLEKSREKVTFLCIGPLTNMALFLRTYPQLAEKIEAIAIMGGAVNSGNIQLKSEFNIYHDPEAAKIVFDSGVKIIMAGLEVCYAGSILLSEAEQANGKGKASQLFYDLMRFYGRYAIDRGWDRTAIFDMTPLIYLLKPELFESREYEVHIELDGKYTRGMTVVDLQKTENLVHPATVLWDVRREEFIQILFESLDILDRRYQ